MNEFQNIKFNYYTNDIKDSKPKGIVNLKQFLDAVQNPKPEHIEIYQKIKECEITGDMGQKAVLKQNLYSFTPAVTCSQKRSYANIVSFSGLLVLDFDKFADHERAVYFKTLISDPLEYPYLIAVWLSASGRGVRCLVNIPVVSTVNEYKELFMGIAYYTELGKVKNFDQAPKNAVLPLFMSYDKDIYINEYSKIWNTKYIEPKPIYINPPVIDYSKKVDVKAIVEKNINQITNEGHPILRATAFTVGGYVGGGYITESEAISLMDWAIQSNEYLNKKASVYQTTARTMIRKGAMQPIFK
jgi:hypothetical protein